MKIFNAILTVAVLVVVGYFVNERFLNIPEAKRASPEDMVEYVNEDLRIDVFYCQPSKRGREIFGELVPFGEVWRTGANEATTFETSIDLTIGGKVLPAGKYTLWTISTG